MVTLVKNIYAQNWVKSQITCVDVSKSSLIDNYYKTTKPIYVQNVNKIYTFRSNASFSKFVLCNRMLFPHIKHENKRSEGQKGI